MTVPESIRATAIEAAMNVIDVSRVTSGPSFTSGIISHGNKLVDAILDAVLPVVVAQVQADEAGEETGWEYRCKLSSIHPGVEHPWVDVDEDHYCSGRRERRRKAGPWVPVCPSDVAAELPANTKEETRDDG